VTTRRVFLCALVGCLLAGPWAAGAQQPGRIWKVGVLAAEPAESRRADGFRQGLRQEGLVEGQNIAIDWRSAEGNSGRYPELAAELVRLGVDVIVAGSAEAVAAAQKATRTIPIVMVYASDPVALGFVVSLARPGANITGLTNQEGDLQGKRLQLLKEVAPNLTRAAVFWDPTEAHRSLFVKEAETAAHTVGVTLRVLEARAPRNLEGAFASMKREGVGGVSVQSSAMLIANRARIADLALQSRLPTICTSSTYTRAGSLMSYAADTFDLFRRAAIYVGKILKGAKPAGLPVEQPTKFELVINLKTAKALGLTIPPSLLQRADEVIQ